MHTIDWVSADSDKASLCWLGGKDNSMVICTLFIFEIKACGMPHLGNKHCRMITGQCQISGSDLPTVMIFFP